VKFITHYLKQSLLENIVLANLKLQLDGHL